MQENALTYSIVIPVYQTGQYLSKCLRSVLEQKYPHKDVVVVLDGPDEAVEKILKEFDGVHVLKSEHIGACHARNIGMDYARDILKTDLVLFLDSDVYLEPGALQDWANVLAKYPDVDFVYSDYRFNVAEMGGVNGQEFDMWLLKCNNYISTMSPVRVKAEPRFDESLKSLQDWDLWLTLAEKGHKGKYLPGVRFVTEVPHAESISGKGCHPKVWMERKNAVKTKHGIEDKPVCFTSLATPERAIAIAKNLDNADFSFMPSFNVHNYKMVYLLGFYSQDAMNHAEVFKRGTEDMRKVIHWLGGDVQALYDAVPLNAAFNLSKVLQRYVNICESVKSKKMLEKIGIRSTVVKLPVDSIDKEYVKPDKFTVLYDIDTPYKKFFKTIIDALPDIEFVELQNMADLARYSLFVRLTTTGILDEPCKKFLLAGRRVMSNIPEPYAGYIEDKDISAFSKELVAGVRGVEDIYRGLKEDETGHKAGEYYSELLSWDTYKETINSILERGSSWKQKVKLSL